MEHHMMSGFGPFAHFGIFAVLAFLLLAVWSIAWKGIALWTAAHENSKPWFIVLLVLNTAGILEIIYIIFFSKRGADYIANWKEKRLRKKQAGHMGSEARAPEPPKAEGPADNA
jgi:methionyl-tRNA synthetase